VRGSGDDVTPDDQSTTSARPWRDRLSPWHGWLGAIVLGALAIRLGYVIWWSAPGREAGDAVYYHVGANLLADGKGFINPITAAYQWREVPGADHPPAYIVYLAIASKLGLRSFFEHQVWSCFLGAATVVLVGFTGRRIAGPTAGLVAAALAAVFPLMWMPDGWMLSETMAMFAVAVVILAAYRCWDEPTRATRLWLGAALGLAALSRSELVLLAPLVAVPLCWYRRRSLGQAAASVLVIAAAAIAVMSPWVIHNLARFDHVVLLSDQSDGTLAAGWCDSTFYGPNIGYKSYECLAAAVRETDPAESWTSYGRAHIERVPVVVAARVGRVWGLFRPAQQVKLEHLFGVERGPLWLGFGMTWMMLAAAPFAAVRYRRRGTPIFPLLAPIVVVTVSVGMTFGQVRYRVPAEPALVLLAVGLLAGRRSPPEADAEDAEQEPAGEASDETAGERSAAPVPAAAR
jgi:4-amino-4-deoxy-L-arabinose transferase-like glycosyltransferase